MTHLHRAGKDKHDASLHEKYNMTRDTFVFDCGATSHMRFSEDGMVHLKPLKIAVIGLAGHKVSQLRIVTAQALVTTHKGDAIATFHKMALLGKDKSILSCLQMEAHGVDINDRSRLLPGGKKRILIDGYQLPLDFKNGLPYLWCRMPTTKELVSLPHIIMTSDIDWEPSQYDKELDDLADFFDPPEVAYEDEHFDQYGEYRHRTVATHYNCLEEEFYDAHEFIDFNEQVDDLLDTIHPEVAKFMASTLSSLWLGPCRHHQAHLCSHNTVCSRKGF
jgi:hypothetical protein